MDSQKKQEILTHLLKEDRDAKPKYSRRFTPVFGLVGAILIVFLLASPTILDSLGSIFSTELDQQEDTNNQIDPPAEKEIESFNPENVSIELIGDEVVSTGEEWIYRGNLGLKFYRSLLNKIQGTDFALSVSLTSNGKTISSDSQVVESIFRNNSTSGLLYFEIRFKEEDMESFGETADLSFDLYKIKNTPTLVGTIPIKEQFFIEDLIQ